MRHLDTDRHIQGCRRLSETTHLTGGSRAVDRHDTTDIATLLRRSYTRAVVGYVSYGDACIRLCLDDRQTDRSATTDMDSLQTRQRLSARIYKTDYS
jgi:hypothetical protein